MARTAGASLGKSLGSFFVLIGADSSEFLKEMRSVQAALRKSIGSEALQLSKQLAQSFMVLSGATLALGAASVKAAADMEQQEIAFTTMLKSAKKAKTFLSDLQAFAMATPFNFKELTDASRRLMALGYSAEQVIPVLNIVGDAVAGLGTGAVGLDRVTLALGQIKQKGKVAAQEMNQLAEAGIGGWKILADAMGKTEMQVRQIAETSGIAATQALPILFEGLNKQFGGLMQKQAQTITGMFSNIVDAVQRVMVEVGNALITGLNLKGWLELVMETLTKFALLVQKVGLKEAIAGIVPPEVLASLQLLAGLVGGPLAVGFALLAQSALLALRPLAPFAAIGLAISAAFLVWQKSSELVRAAMVALGVAVLWLNREAIAALIVSVGSKLYTAFITAIGGAGGLSAVLGGLSWRAAASAGIIGVLVAAFGYVAFGSDKASIAILKGWEWVRSKLIAIVNGIIIAFGNLELKINQVFIGIFTKFRSLAENLDKIPIFGQKLEAGALKAINSDLERMEKLSTLITDRIKQSEKAIESSKHEYELWKKAYDQLWAEADAKEKAGQQTEDIKKVLADIEKQMADAQKKNEEATKKFLESLKEQTGTAGGIGGGGKTLEDLAKDAKTLHDRIRQEWLNTTRTEEEQTDAWYKDQLSALEASKAANVNYLKDLEMLNETYQVKLRDIAEKEYEEEMRLIEEKKRAAMELLRFQEEAAKALAELNKVGPTAGGPQDGAGKLLFEVDNQAKEWLNTWDNVFDEWSRRWREATAEQRDILSKEIFKAVGEFSVAENGKITAAKARAEKELEIERWKEQQKALIYTSGRALEAEMQNASDEGRLADYMALLSNENAAFLSALEGRKQIENTYRNLQLEANRSYLSYLSEAYNTLYSGLTNTITGIIMGTKNAGDALKELAKQVVEMVVRWMVQRKVAAALSRGLMAAEAATSASMAAATAAAWAPAASMVSLATFGANAAAAAAGISSVTALSRGLAVPFANGGIVRKPTLAMIGEGGDSEAVIPLNRKTLGMLGGGGGNVTVNVHNNTGLPVNARVEQTVDAQGQIVNLFLDAYARNKNGLRTALKG